MQLPWRWLNNLITWQTFKKHITSKFNESCVPPYFTIGNKYISVLYARLRNRCSYLYNDLFRNYICDNPLCDFCSVEEDAIHYFFHCRKFTIKRQVFNDTGRVFQPLSINLIIFGNEKWNIKILKTIISCLGLSSDMIMLLNNFSIFWLFVWRSSRNMSWYENTNTRWPFLNI